MDIYEIRRRNLWYLVHPRGYSVQGVRRFADATGKTEQRIRHLIAKSPDDEPAKTIGSNSAREFEQLCGTDSGWMDQEHPELWGVEYFRASKLRELIDLYGNEGKLADQLDFDEEYIKKLSTQKLYIDDSIARQFEEILALPELWFDVDEQHQYKNVNTRDDEPDLITIEQYKDVRGAMGRGAYLLDTEGEVVDWRVTPQWVNSNLPANTGVKNLRIITGLGNSMKGLYNSGDPLIIDTGIKSVDFDAVYFFRVGDEGFVKLLQRVPGEGIRVKSLNPDYDTWTIRDDMDLEVFGRVLKVWEGKDL